MPEYLSDELIEKYWTPKLSNDALNSVALERALSRRIAKKGRRTLVLYGNKSPNTTITVDGKIQESIDGIIYTIESDCSFTGKYNIQISGNVELLSQNSISYYPALYKGEIRELPIRQDVYCHWMSTDYFDKSLLLLQYKHLILGGPTFADLDNNTEVYEYDTDIKIEPYNYELNMQKLQ